MQITRPQSSSVFPPLILLRRSGLGALCTFHPAVYKFLPLPAGRAKAVAATVGVAEINPILNEAEDLTGDFLWPHSSSLQINLGVFFCEPNTKFNMGNWWRKYRFYPWKQFMCVQCAKTLKKHVWTTLTHRLSQHWHRLIWILVMLISNECFIVSVTQVNKKQICLMACLKDPTEGLPSINAQAS